MKKTFFSQCCMVISVLTLILGLVISILLSYKYGIVTETREYLFSDDEIITYRDLGKTLIFFFSGSIISFISFVVWGAIGQMLSSLATIVDNLNINKEK